MNRQFGGAVAKSVYHTMLTDPRQTLFENLNTAVLAFDHGLQLTEINPAGEMLFQVSRRKIIGKELSALLPRGRRLAKILSRTLTRLHPFTARGVRLTLPDGRTIAVDCTVTPLIDRGKATGILVEMSQVDRLLRLAREESTRDRHAANRAVIKGLAHEIKNPLGGLRGAAQLLERELEDRSLKEYTGIIIHEADRLRKLVDRMIGPSQPLKQEAVNIHQVFEHVRKLLLAENPVGLTIVPKYDPSLPSFIGDPEQIVQAVLNIAKNSVQAMKGKGTIILRTHVTRQFTIGQKLHRLVLCAQIEDDGPGIPAELVEHIFYPMVTGRPEGTGLGLAIAQDIANQHGGLIECSSNAQQTIFTLYLPLESGSG